MAFAAAGTATSRLTTFSDGTAEPKASVPQTMRIVDLTQEDFRDDEDVPLTGAAVAAHSAASFHRQANARLRWCGPIDDTICYCAYGMYITQSFSERLEAEPNPGDETMTNILTTSARFGY